MSRLQKVVLLIVTLILLVMLALIAVFISQPKILLDAVGYGKQLTPTTQ